MADPGTILESAAQRLMEENAKQSFSTVRWKDLSDEAKENWRKCAWAESAPSSTPVAATDYIRPAHYGGADDLYEAIKVMEAWHGPEAVYWFCTLSAEKYLSRMGKKQGEPMERDAKKAAWYLDYAAKLREKIEKKP